MDKVTKYAQYIESILYEYAKFTPIGNWKEYENQVIVDKDLSLTLLL